MGESGTALLKWMAESQYAAYILHVFIVLGFQAALVGMAWPPLAKFLLVTAASSAAAFAVGAAVRRPFRL